MVLEAGKSQIRVRAWSVLLRALFKARKWPPLLGPHKAEGGSSDVSSFYKITNPIVGAPAS